MRRPGLLLALPVGLLVLAGCNKPVPYVTIQANGTSVRSPAVNYVDGGKTITNRDGAKVLTVRPGDHVNISVDRQTAKAGWVVLLGGQKISPVLTRDTHHFSFDAPSFSGGAEAPLAIFQQPPNGGPAAGSWVFTLRENI